MAAVTTTTTDWILYEADAAVRDAAGLEATRWPVRASAVADVVGPRVDVAVLVEEADRWCDEHPDGGASLNDDIARLAWMAAIDALDDHRWAEAVHVLTIGLRHDRHNISLWSHLALARTGEGRTEAALAAFQQAIVECRRASFFAPVLWITAARAFDEAGQARVALRLLEDVAAFLPDDDAFWDLLAAVRARAASA